jgi:hypothetical protein
VPEGRIIEAVETQVPRRKTNFDRDRFEVRADAEWIRRATAAADRFGLSLSAFVRLVVSERMEELDRNPAPTPPRRKGGVK